MSIFSKHPTKTTVRTIDPHVSVCRMCGGSGRTEQSVCPQCEGSGRVIVSSEVKTTVEPYKMNK